MKRFLAILMALVVVVAGLSVSLAQSAEATVTRNPLNFRSSPSIRSTVLDSLAFESTYPALSQTVSGYWVQLQVGEVSGWVCARFVSLNTEGVNLALNTQVVDEDCSGVTITVNPGVIEETIPVATEEAVVAEVPTVTFTSVPDYGVRGTLRGVVTGIEDLSQYKAACFLYRGGWYNKPYWNRPGTSIRADGRFSCDVSTGNGDEYATMYTVYIIPIGLEIPLLSGGSLSSSFTNQAIAVGSLSRPAQ